MAESTPKVCRTGTERASALEATLARIRPLAARMGITRVANVTGLDRIGIPVVAVHRPNSRSLAVAQGKGATLVAAQVSGLMESIETFHAEQFVGPLLFGSHRELARKHRVVDVRGLPRLTSSSFHSDRPILWAAGTNLFDGEKVLVPYEMVHTDFRVPLPSGSGCFLMSSNGLASGNCFIEAVSHAICELVERDANSLWHLSGQENDVRSRLDWSTVDDESAQSILLQFRNAGVDALAWETTSDLGISSFLCTVVEREREYAGSAPPVAGSGCHPRRNIALLRALTEAAQGRLTIISGARDDLSTDLFRDGERQQRGDALRALAASCEPGRSFAAAPDVEHETFEEDVQWQLGKLASAGLGEAVAVNLTDPGFAIPVVKMIIPYLEGMSEMDGYVPGARARAAARPAERSACP